MRVTIDWTQRPVRDGLNGALDRFIGPGATRAEIALSLGAALAAALLLLLVIAAQGLEWTPVQTLLGVLLAFDLAGGIATNATQSAKRWYHRSGQGARQHLSFTALHGVHLLLVMFAFYAGDWGYFGLSYGYLLGAALLIVGLPLALRRPVALLAALGGVLLSLYGLPAVAGLEWFLPAFYLKLLVAHLLREEPYAI